MIKTLNINLVDTLAIAIMPIFIAILNPHFSHEYLLYLYTFIALGMMVYNIEMRHKKAYGDFVYRRENRNCDFGCWVGQTLILILMMWIRNLYQLDILWFAVMATTLQLLLIQKHLSIVLYTKGMMYKGRFFKLEAIQSGHLVKNYKSMYEIHIEKKKLILNASELALTQRKG